MYKWISLLIILCSFCPTIFGAQSTDEWLTLYEKSHYLETPRYDETIAFCKKLADYSPIVSFTDFGVSPQGRKLPLLIIDKDSEFDPQLAHRRGKVVLLVQAGIHAGEIEGKDAGLSLVRDIVVHGKYQQALDNVVILLIPIFNVDGHERFGAYNRINQNGPAEMGWRTTAQNLNLNRDFVKADAPEMRCWLGMFNRWLPDFLVDVHTTDGADFQYIITYSLETNRNVAKPLADWCDDAFLPEINERMIKSGFPMTPYVVPRVDHDVTSGLMSWTATPRFSNGYGAAQNRPFMLIETHMLKTYQQRVESTYQLLHH
ncbi:MAG: M14 family metallopeptidase, partial [candidate division Zixibacteria bacterium]|nr:M14 family metallopeptidase [candidate division Zixibacteria bacterium]